MHAHGVLDNLGSSGASEWVRSRMKRRETEILPYLVVFKWGDHKPVLLNLAPRWVAVMTLECGLVAEPVRNCPSEFRRSVFLQPARSV